jgi:ABC-type multidrug transport system ATPase subunit
MAIIDEGRVKAQGSMDDIRHMLVQARRVSVRVPDSQVDRAAEVLSADANVTDTSVERAMVRFTLAGDDSDSSDLLATVVEAGVGVIEWRIEAAGLEELFMKLTEVSP